MKLENYTLTFPDRTKISFVFPKEMLDKYGKPCYNKGTKTKENKDMTYYFKSIYSGQVYKAPFKPKFGGWEETTEEEYIAYCEKMGMKP